MKRKLIVIAIVVLLMSSCARTFTPYESANKKMKCGRGTLR
jgi:PBP1b-binding outer membrane lipoprotein LpoB